jgi:hypothetical protein
VLAEKSSVQVRQIKNETRKLVSVSARDIAAHIASVTYAWIPCGQNAHVDHLANEATPASRRAER